MSIKERRSFIGACFAGLAGTTALNTGLFGKNREVLEKRIVVPTELASQFESFKNPVLITDVDEALKNPAFHSILDNSLNDAVWFGCSHNNLLKMSHTKYEEFIHAHFEVNRKFGVAPTSYEERCNGGMFNDGA